MSKNSLNAKLTAALASREKQKILRQSPSTDTAVSSVSPLIDFSSGDYLSFAVSQRLRNNFVQRLTNAPDVLGTGGSRLLANSKLHEGLEERVRRFFGTEAALIFNSGCSANIGFFSTIPQAGDFIVHDENMHASVYDGMRASRARDKLNPFSHNSCPALHKVLTELVEQRPGLRSGTNSIFVVVESLYSMDGTFAPLAEIAELLESPLFPHRNAYLVVDEAHCFGIYGRGRGRVAELGLESKVFARTITFSKVVASSGGAVLCSGLVRDYLFNHARSLIFTVALTYSNVIAVDCSFDFLEDGTAEQLSQDLLRLSSHFISFLMPKLAGIPPELLSLSCPDPEKSSSPPSHIVCFLTPLPWSLAEHFLSLRMYTSAITPPAVKPGENRVRVCLHAGNKMEDVEKLAVGAVQWARSILKRQDNETAVLSRL
ncbi:hypothetical protein DXG01_003395 [Tephrocybe rancida]|nr:hypothetical protein DXG01_003395 [Tephrocybe rancida]